MARATGAANIWKMRKAAKEKGELKAEKKTKTKSLSKGEWAKKQKEKNRKVKPSPRYGTSKGEFAKKQREKILKKEKEQMLKVLWTDHNKNKNLKRKVL